MPLRQNREKASEKRLTILRRDELGICEKIRKLQDLGSRLENLLNRVEGASEAAHRELDAILGKKDE